jgi:hypothetical protein
MSATASTKSTKLIHVHREPGEGGALRYSFSSSGGKLFARVECSYPTRAGTDPWGNPTVEVDVGGRGRFDTKLTAAELLRNARDGALGLTLADCPARAEIEAERAAEAAAEGRVRAERLAAEEERRQAEQAKAEAQRARAREAPTPHVAALVWYWSPADEPVSGAPRADGKPFPLPAVVIASRPRRDVGPPPEVSLVVFGETRVAPRGWRPYSAEPQVGAWCWPEVPAAPAEGG